MAVIIYYQCSTFTGMGLFGKSKWQHKRIKSGIPYQYHTTPAPIKTDLSHRVFSGSRAFAACETAPSTAPGRGGRPHHATVACVAPPAADSSAVREVKGAHTHATCNATSSAQKVQPARHCSHVFTSRLPDPSHAATLSVDSLRTNRTMT